MPRSRSANVDAGSAVRGVPGRGDDVGDLLTHGSDVDGEVGANLGQPVDRRGPRACGVDDDVSGDAGAVFEQHGGDAVRPAVEPDHGTAQDESRAVPLGRPGEVLRGELRVGDVARVRGVNGAERALGVIEEAVVGDRFGRPVAADVDAGDAPGEGRGVPLLEGNPGPLEQREEGAARGDVDVEHGESGAHVASHPRRVLAAEVVAPRLPGELRLPCRGHARPGREVEPDDRAGGAGGALSDPSRLVDDDDRAAASGELQRDPGADHPGADDDGVGYRAIQGLLLNVRTGRARASTRPAEAAKGAAGPAGPGSPWQATTGRPVG